MRFKSWMAAGAVLLLSGSVARAQFPGMGGGGVFNQDRTDSRGNRSALIKRKGMTGTLKSSDPAKKLLVLSVLKSKEAFDVPVDVGPVPIQAGKGHATVADLKPGDRLSVFGEVTIQGGLRAMEVMAPAERMSIPPPEKPKKVKKPKQSKPPKDAKKPAEGEEKPKEG